ncbi:capsule biosynthesis protein [Kluyvera ascorbata]|uniref:capsule biosynthesis protein n=1 Tax=Kluyvera ascorbata TaxID=51288 RepID=UPI001FEC460A|nr:capsule biosynthesis protein [Kluyvera ascorbata]
MKTNHVFLDNFLQRFKCWQRQVSVFPLQHYLAHIIITAPMAMLVIYLAIFSQPRYISESKVAVKRPNEIDSSSLNVGLLLGASNPSSAEDSLYLKEYINSPDMLKALDKQLNFHHAFSQSGWDPFYHLSDNASSEDFLDYYRNRITIAYDEKSGLLNIQTQGFTPAFAQAFNLAVLKESERFINELSHRISREQMQFAEDELRQTRQRLNESKKQLLTYQNRNNVLDPTASAEAATALVNTLIGKKIEMEADLRNLLTYLRADAPQVVSTKNAIKALQAQIDEEQSKITAPEGKKLNSMAVDFEEIKGTVAFDADLYALALKALEKTRMESARKLKTLSVISSPQRPQESAFPNIPYLLISWLLVCGLLFGTAKLLLGIIEDHKD